MRHGIMIDVSRIGATGAIVIIIMAYFACSAFGAGSRRVGRRQPDGSI